MKEWMEQCLVFAVTYVSGMYLAYRIDQRRPPKPSLSSESVDQFFDKAGQFFRELNRGPINSEAFVRVMAGSDPEMRKLLEKFFSDIRGSGSGE